MTIERTKIEKPSWGILVDSGSVVSHLRRIEIVEPVAYGLRVEKGGFAALTNSLITTRDGYGVKIESNTPSTTTIVTLRHLTLVDTGGVDNPAIQVGDGFAKVSATINAVVRDTILAGYTTPLKCDSPETNSSLSVGYSYLLNSATKSGNCNVSVFNSLDSALPAFGPPQFLAAGNYRLPAGSPAIDAGDPATVSLPTEDLLGAPRPVDGNGDGVARRDIGAYEYQPPKVPPGGNGGPDGPGGGGAEDVEPPQTTILKGPGRKLGAGIARFRFRSSEAGSRFVCKLDKRKARPCKSSKRYTRLKPGRHRFKVWAIDPAGNKDPTPAKRRFKVPG